MKVSTKEWIMVGSAGASLLAILIGLLFFELTSVNLSYLTVIVVGLFLFPFSGYDYWQQNKIKKMEDQFPIFLKDLADSLRAGVTMSEAVRTASNSDYHELNSEIRRMSNEMSWGVAFEQSVNEFMVRIKNSSLISRGLAILLQAYKSGGDISPIMTRVADSTILLQNVEKDQESSMTEQTAVIYIIQFVFVIIVIILFKVLLPVINSGGFGGEFIGAQSGNIDMQYYKGFFFITMAIQCVCNGLVAGVTKNGSLTSGVKHVAIMFSVSLVLFSLFILPSILSVTAVSEKYSVAVGETFNIFGTVSYDSDAVINEKVEAVLGNNTFSGYTDASGDYSITVTAPDIRGINDGIVRVTHDEQTGEATFTYSVR